MLRPAVHPGCSRSVIAATQIESELGRDDQLSSEWSERLAHQFFVGEGAIDLSCVEERDSAVYRGVKKVRHLFLVLRRPIGKTHAHASQPDRRNFQITFSKLAFLHCYSLNS